MVHYHAHKIVLGFSVVITTLLLTACQGDNVMNDDLEGLDETKITLHGKEIVITKSEAKQMGDALKTFIQTNPVEHKEFLLKNLPKSQGWIDYEGIVRVGLWVLGEFSDRLALTYRPPPSLELGTVMFVASLAKKDSAWYVLDVEAARIMR